MKPPETCVAVYLRVSTHEQATNGWSMEGQLKDIRDYCDFQGYKVVRIYKDPGLSGTTLERPSLQRMLEHSGAGYFSKVIIWKYDRLSRDNIQFPTLMHFLNKRNIEVVSVKEPTPNDDSPYNEFIIGILGLLSSLERKTTIMRCKMGRKVRAEKGLWKGGITPYGYDYNEATGYLEINPMEAEGVRVIFNKYLECLSLRGTARFMNEQDIPPRKAENWRDVTIKCMIVNRTYIGEYTEGEFVHHYEDYRIIDDELFSKVQKRIGAGKAPAFGYKNDFELGEVVINPEEAEIVKKIFELYLEYKYLPPLVQYLKDNNLFGKYGEDRGLYDTALIRILTNPVYVGHKFGQGLKGEIIHDDSLRIIDKEVFLEVQLLGEVRYKTFKPKQKRALKLRERLIEEMFEVGENSE